MIEKTEPLKHADIQQGTKYDVGKVRLDLIPPDFILGIGDVFTYGAEKYGDYNWMQGIKYSRLYAATQRHLNKFWYGELLDDESHLHHLFHAGANLAMLVGMQDEFDDRQFLTRRLIHETKKG